VLVGGRGGDFLDALLTVVWGRGITASFSILELNMDGLCAGVAAMASVFFAMLAYLSGQTLVTTLAAAVLGAATDFSAGISNRRRFSWATAAPCFSDI